MMRMKWIICLFSVFALVGVEADENFIDDIEEILVQASLLPISSKRSANAITIINSDQIKNRTVLSISDLLRDVPGLAVSKSGVQGSQTQIRVRGSEANHLLVLIDGIEANNSAQSDEFSWGTLMANDIERIEIIRGPQSSMLGSDAMSGVINIITKSADAPKSMSIFSEAGSFKTQNSGVNIGLNSDNFNSRLSLSEIKTDGKNISRLGEEKDGYNNQNISFKSGWTINEKLKSSFVARQSDGSNDYDSDTNFDGLVDDQDNIAKFENSTKGLKVDYLGLEKKWQHQLAISNSKNENKDFTRGLLGTQTASSKDQLRLISSAQLNKLSNRISFLAEHEKEDFSQRGQVNDYGAYGIFNPNQDRQRKTSSAALEYRADILDNITAAASVRRDNNSEFKDSSTYRLEVILDANNALRVRGAYGTAVKNPTFTERFGFYTNFIGNPILQPEKSKNWELGFDHELLNRSWKISATIFNSDLDNEIDGNALDPITFGYTAINKIGTSKRKGIELNASGNLQETLTLSISYTFTDSQELDASGIYQREVRRPRHIASLNLYWQQSDSFNISANIQHNGSQQDIVFPSNVKLSKYTVANLSANLSINTKLDAYLRLENLFDENYEEVYGYQPLSFGAYLGIRYKL